MKATLLKLEKEQIIDDFIELQERIPGLEEEAAKVPVLELRLEKMEQQFAKLQKMLFGQKSERFVAVTPDGQLVFELGLEAEKPQEIPEEEELTYTRKKKTRKEKPSRQALPADLRRETVVIEPKVDLTGALMIGEEVTEILEYRPGEFWVRRIVRTKYVWSKQEERGVAIAPLPSQPIDKGIPAASLLALIIVEKYVDHLPLYRQVQRFKRLGMRVPMSTICGWVAQSAELLSPLYHVLMKKVLECGYIQVDETTIKVLDQITKGKAHLGYHWIYHDPIRGLVLFDYRKGRSREGPEELLGQFCGYLQTDGYKVYDRFEKGSYPAITVLACMAHARRYFHDALKNDPKRAEQALLMIQQIYQIEREAREQNLSHEQRHILRQEKALPVLDQLKTWLFENLTQTTPKSAIGEAIAYSLRRWKKLCNYTLDGKLEIDNNLAENSIRPIALGRKNYLFAGSHKGAKHAAMLYSFLATCKKNGVEPYTWLKDVLSRIKEHPVNRLEELIPGKWQPLNEKANE